MENKPTGPPPPYSAVNQQPQPSTYQQPPTTTYQPPPPSAYVPHGYGLPPHQPGQYYPQAGAPGPNGQTVVTVQPVIVKVGDCPACRVGTLEETFSCVGIMCAIFCFPLGLIPCLLLRNQFCPNCGAIYAGGAPRVYATPATVVGVTTTQGVRRGKGTTTVYQAI